MTARHGADPDDIWEDEIPPDVVGQLLRAFNRSPSSVITLIGSDLKTRWISQSAKWVTGTDPAARKGQGSLERIHPDDVGPLIHALDQLRSARPRNTPTVPVIEPLRYRVRHRNGNWFTMESLVLNLLDDPVVDGIVLIGRPVGGDVSGMGHVVDLLVAEAPLGDVLAACAGLVPRYLGRAAVIARIDGEVVIGVPPGSPAARLSKDERWWRGVLEDGEPWGPADFEGFPEDLAAQGRAEGFTSAWLSPLFDALSDDVVGAIVTWVKIAVERNVATDDGLRQAERLAGLVIGEQRRHHDLRRQAITDPLTGLGNRSALRRRLQRVDGTVTVAVVDLDNFKPVNDNYGHDTGDVVLQMVADRISRSVREDDLVVRFGGDEFVVVFAEGTDAGGARGLLARLVAAIEEPILLDGGITLSVGASAGLATGAPGDVMHLADTALYDAKRAK